MQLFHLSLLISSVSSTLMYTDFTLTSNNPSVCAACTLPTVFNAGDVKACLEKVPAICQYSVKVVKIGESEDTMTLCPDTLGFIMRDLAADIPGATQVPGQAIGFTATLPAGDTCNSYYWQSSHDSKCVALAAGAGEAVAVKDRSLYISAAGANRLDSYWNLRGETGKQCATKLEKVVLRHLTAKLSVKGLKDGDSTDSTVRMTTGSAGTTENTLPVTTTSAGANDSTVPMTTASAGTSDIPNHTVSLFTTTTFALLTLASLSH